MTRARPLPIGPLALALRHLPPGSGHRTAVVLALVAVAALLGGLGLLLLG